MSAANSIDLLQVAQAASSLFTNLVPMFGFVLGVSVLLGLVSYLLRALRTVGDPLYDEDEMPLERPKNKAVGMNADGEIVYSEPADTPMFYPHDHLG